MTVQEKAINTIGATARAAFWPSAAAHFIKFIGAAKIQKYSGPLSATNKI